jgi:hypothetical protein
LVTELRETTLKPGSTAFPGEIWQATFAYTYTSVSEKPRIQQTVRLPNFKKKSRVSSFPSLLVFIFLSFFLFCVQRAEISSHFLAFAHQFPLCPLGRGPAGSIALLLIHVLKEAFAEHSNALTPLIALYPRTLVLFSNLTR